MTGAADGKWCITWRVRRKQKLAAGGGRVGTMWFSWLTRRSASHDWIHSATTGCRCWPGMVYPPWRRSCCHPPPPSICRDVRKPNELMSTNWSRKSSWNTAPQQKGDIRGKYMFEGSEGSTLVSVPNSQLKVSYCNGVACLFIGRQTPSSSY